jgi:hypothetical protein
MIFTPDSIQMIENGTKTQTRRPVKEHAEGTWMELGKITEVVTSKASIKWGVGRTYAIQPGRGKKSVGRIKLTSIACERVCDITDEDAIKEGVEQMRYKSEIIGHKFTIKDHQYSAMGGMPREAFLKGWKHLYPKSDLNELVWALTFERVKL